MKVAIVLGTRPEIMKNYSIVKALREQGQPHLVLHTNQHHDAAMSDAVFAQMGYRPDATFPHEYSLGAAIDWVRRQIAQHGVDLVLVNGDTAAALVGALAAVYADTGLAHVEAGLRAFDRQMYEERNRIMVDAAAHYLFTYARHQSDYLARIPDLRGRIMTVGNTTVDLIEDFGHRLLRPHGGRYAYVTLHRKEFTDQRSRMVAAFAAVSRLSREFDRVVFPMHPRTRHAMREHGIGAQCLAGVDVIDPIEPLDSLAQVRHAEVVITDSGCLQEEALLMSTPCVTVRENTERPETLEGGANVLTGFCAEKIVESVRSQRRRKGLRFPSVYGGPGAGRRIVQALNAHFVDWTSY